MSDTATIPSSKAASLSAGWADGYKPPQGRHDEFKAQDGAVRPAWGRFASALESLASGELERRDAHLRELIRENGITYNVYGEPGIASRPWGMDLMPMILEWEEWRRIEEALRQRVHLLNLVLQDLYGPQTLLERRIIPSELVLGNPAFLRPCHGIVPPQSSHIHIYGADLARAPDGRWWVLADRLDAPSGIGYALENRALSSRVMHDCFRENRIARLPAFFQTMRESFEALAARRTDNPRIVFLTPGPANETYFEQSFLARNLGYALVEGGDLTVRGGRVFLKTLTGMQPVDVILRRVDSDFCDPLELREDSLLGVPGLLQAARAGGVTLANALGCGLLQSPGLSPFLPTLCRNLLGEELKMNSVATWWCGQPRELAYVLEHLDDLIIEPAFIRRTDEQASMPRGEGVTKEEWRARLQSRPGAWCARERMALATTPVFEDGRLAPRLFHFRAMLVARGGDYHAMPGGLTRIPADTGDISVSMQRGGRSKDTWVLLPPESSKTVDVSPASTSVRLRRQAADLPSRTADNLYWLGRYVERTEWQARVLRVLAGALAEEGAATDPDGIAPLFEELTLGRRPRLFKPEDPETLDLGAAEKTLRALLWDAKLIHGLAANAARLESVAYRVKERLSPEAWKLLGKLPRAERKDAGDVDDPLADLAGIITLLSAISGLVMENMTRGYGWRFLELGRRVERGMSAAGLLARSLAWRRGTPLEALMQNLLTCFDSQLTYRRRYLTDLHLVPLLDLLVCDEGNPRSLAFQLQAVRTHLEALPRSAGEDPLGPQERLAMSLYSRARVADARVMAQEDAAGARPALAEFLSTVSRELAAFSDALGQTYFAHGNSGVFDMNN